MTFFWIYTGSNEQEALEKANQNLNLINQKTQEICGQDWADNPQRLTANPEFEEHIYYYGFQKPYQNIENGAEFDREEIYQSSWMLNNAI
jgi:hypothetical protein